MLKLRAQLIRPLFMYRIVFGRYIFNSTLDPIIPKQRRQSTAPTVTTVLFFSVTIYLRWKLTLPRFLCRNAVFFLSVAWRRISLQHTLFTLKMTPRGLFPGAKRKKNKICPNLSSRKNVASFCLNFHLFSSSVPSCVSRFVFPLWHFAARRVKKGAEK